MKIQRPFKAIVALLGCLTVLLAAVPAFGHDPLRDSHVRHERNNGDAVNTRAGLADARSEIVKFRETGDDQHLDHARRMLAPALNSNRASAETLIVAAFVEQSRHNFVRAIELIEESLSINHNNDEAWLLLASIQLVVGDVGSAATACSQLRASSPVILLTCKARVALANGNHELALNRLQRILLLVDDAQLPVETRAWSYSVAGDLAVAAGALQEARILYRQSLTLAERTQVRSALVDVLLAISDYSAAKRTLDEGSAALPLLVRRLIVARHLGRLQELEPTLVKLQQEFDVWIANDDWLHAREMARFYIDVVNQPDRARRLALINLTLQQEPEDRRLEQRTRGVAGRMTRNTTSGPSESLCSPVRCLQRGVANRDLHSDANPSNGHAILR